MLYIHKMLLISQGLNHMKYIDLVTILRSKGQTLAYSSTNVDILAKDLGIDTDSAREISQIRSFLCTLGRKYTNCHKKYVNF